MRLVILCFILVSSSAFGQILSGAIKDEGRAMLTQTNFIFEGRSNGFGKYELSVNREGKVTGIRCLDTDIKSTPTRYELENYLKTIRFEKGTYYPKFHHAVVKFTVVRPVRVDN